MGLFFRAKKELSQWTFSEPNSFRGLMRLRKSSTIISFRPFFFLFCFVFRPNKATTVSFFLNKCSTIIYFFLFMGMVDVENLRVVKAILHWFKLIFGLKVNFCKNNLYGFNVSKGWIKCAIDIQHCRVGKVHFIYLDILIGGNSSRKRF